MHDHMKNEKYKVAIITGGSKGLGLEIVHHFLKFNFKVFTCARAKQLREINHPNLFYIQGNVCDQDIHLELAETAFEKFGNLNVYINNAGLSKWIPLKEIDNDNLDELFKTNIYSAFWGCQAAAKYMQPNDVIINISSIAGKRGSKNNSAYVATKFAMNGLTQSLSKELGEKGIRVNAVCPVLVETEGLMFALNNKNSPGYPDPKEFLERFKINQSSLGRLPNSEEVASLVYFLASKEASAITGQCINVDCGVFPQ